MSLWIQLQGFRPSSSRRAAQTSATNDSECNLESEVSENEAAEDDDTASDEEEEWQEDEEHLVKGDQRLTGTT